VSASSLSVAVETDMVFKNDNQKRASGYGPKILQKILIAHMQFQQECHLAVKSSLFLHPKPLIMKEGVLLQIANPCHENWESMNAREQGRYCQSCRKTVVDSVL